MVTFWCSGEKVYEGSLVFVLRVDMIVCVVENKKDVFTPPVFFEDTVERKC